MFNLISAFFGSKIKLIFIVLLIICVSTAFITYKRALNKADEAERALSEYKAVVLSETRRIRNENNRKLKESIKIARESQEAYLELAKKYQFNRDQSRKNIERLKNENSYTNIHNFNGLRAQQSDSNERVSKSNADPERLAEIRQECDATIARIVSACQITTADYNRCRDILDQDTELFGRDEF